MTAIDWRAVQTRLKVTADGAPGPVTWAALVAFAASTARPDSDAVRMRGRTLAERAAAFELDTPARLAGFLSNTTHETGDYRRLRENLNYSTAAQIRRTWPSRFPTDASAAPFVHQPEALANKVYARPGEGNTHVGDGWRFRGGGDIQVTFRNGFRAAGRAIGLPLEDHPELIETPAVAVLTALAYWRDHRVNRFLDAGEAKRARALINCGNPDARDPIGCDDVERRHARLRGLLS